MAVSIDAITYQLKLLNKITQIPLSILTDKGKVIQSFPFEECKVDFSLSPSIMSSLIESAEQIPFFGIDNQTAIYSVLQINQKEGLYLFVGPANLIRDIDLNIYHKNSILFNEISSSVLEAITALLPVVNYYNFFYLLQILYFEIHQIKFSTDQFLSDNPPLDTIIEAKHILFSRRETSVYHHSYIGELLMCDVIRNGQVDKLAEAARFSEKGGTRCNSLRSS